MSGKCCASRAAEFAPAIRAIFGNGQFVGVFQESLGADLHVLELESVDLLLERFGEIPLPPYLERDSDAHSMTTATKLFLRSTPERLPRPPLDCISQDQCSNTIRSRGVTVATITLHVGIGTFLPIRTEKAEHHILRPERYEVRADVAALLQAAVREERRVIAVGTTTTRTLEYLMQKIWQDSGRFRVRRPLYIAGI